jgi:hypothetical protein
MRLRASPANKEFKEKVRAKKKLIAHFWLSLLQFLQLGLFIQIGLQEVIHF